MCYDTGSIYFTMQQQELIPNLFRTEYRKIVSVLCATFGIDHIELAEDIASDTFVTATETWGMKGLPENPVAWLYTVAKNKAKNHFKRSALFTQKLAVEIKRAADTVEAPEIDLSDKSINDSQLAMMFTVCHPCISTESQIALALHLLCGFGIQEIADAFLTNKEVVYKRLNRAKEKLKAEQIAIVYPTTSEIESRLDVVLTTLYLLFNEGYYSTSQNTVLRKDLCIEAMRLNYMLIENDITNQPAANALFALMCFHASRFDARTNEAGDMILYEDQDTTLWNHELIEKGNHYLNQAAHGTRVSRYHLEAGIAYWHTCKEDTPEKWESILQLYNHLLIREYSPIAALNRTYALAKANGKEAAIIEAEKLQLENNRFYYSLLGDLYTGIDNNKALAHFQRAIELTPGATEKAALEKYIRKLSK